MAGFLAGGQVFSLIEATTIRYFIEENPDHLHYGLSVVSQTMANYARETVGAGADGIFLTTTEWVSS